MRVALIYTDEPFYTGAGYDRAWAEALSAFGAAVDLVPSIPTASPPAWDLAIAHVLVEEVVAYAPTFRAAALLEASGVPAASSAAASFSVGA